jgi:hypothetical protein
LTELNKNTNAIFPIYFYDVYPEYNYYIENIKNKRGVKNMKFNLDLPESVHSELKILAVTKKESMNNLIVKFIIESMKNEKKENTLI